jgi:hypothetical protein
MFVRIGNERIKISTISGYTYKGKSPSTGKYYMELTISNRKRLLYFDTDSDLCDVMDYLDSVLKVSVI